MPKYSFLTSDPNEYLLIENIRSLICSGVKVMIFCSAMHQHLLRRNLEWSSKQHLLKIFIVSNNNTCLTIVDGESIDKDIDLLIRLSKLANDFNLEQYLIEHANPNQSLLIEAGAGTGKTTAMIDRIMYLMHTQPDLKFQDIGMITFTNEATSNMRRRIQKELALRLKITKNPKYIEWLENCTFLHIQTIHSFSREYLVELAPLMGYNNSITISSNIFEKQQIVIEILNDLLPNDLKSISSIFGARLHELVELISGYWTQIENMGLTDSEIERIDWGNPVDKNSGALHQTLVAAMGLFNKRYSEMKLQNDSIAVGDIIRELRRILESGKVISVKSLPLRYLFVDEFQDSDNSQIQMVAWLNKHMGVHIFAVGDTKQSIYRFRGAVDTAFNKLRELMTNNGVVHSEFSLRRNYRTSKDILEVLDPIFQGWHQLDLLNYGTSLTPQTNIQGNAIFNKVLKKDSVVKQETIRLMKHALSDCLVYNDSLANIDETQRVVVLTRTNWELKKIKSWCQEANIPHYFKEDGTFYTSDAIMDLYALIKALVYPRSTIHLFDFINSSFIPRYVDIKELSEIPPESEKQVDYLKSHLIGFDLEETQKKLKLEPILAVIRQLTENPDLMVIYLNKKKHTYEGWTNDALLSQLNSDSKRYTANMYKALQILRKQFSNNMVSLYQIYHFLKINIGTNHTENEEDISMLLGTDMIIGSTVHKAKGLEFDSVIIPFTKRKFRQDDVTELLFDTSGPRVRIGWCYTMSAHYSLGQASKKIGNNHYFSLLPKEFSDIEKEEARLLYVAMTRAKRKLYCSIVGNDDHTWAKFLEGSK